MKFAYAIAVFSLLGSIEAQTKILEGEQCFVQFEANNGKYKIYGEMCDTGLDCNYLVGDDGVTTDPIAGICEPQACLGTNSNQPPAEGTSRVTICHRKCSENNPWVRITIDEDGWDGAGCGHGLQHDIWEDCNMELKDETKWGNHHADYVMKVHGTREQVRRQLEIDNNLPVGSLLASPASAIENNYLRKWEPACPYVRNGQCCDWDNGDCCGDDPARVPAKIAGSGGDPHIKRWDRKNFDFHGECDMVLVTSREIGLDDRSLDVHIRTTITDHSSSIQSAAMKIGTFHLQVDTDKIYLGGKVYTGPFPATINEVTLLEPTTDGTLTNYTVVLTNYTHFDNTTKTVQSSITFQSIGAFLNVRIEGHKYDFGKTAAGLVGDWELGKARNRAGYRFTTLGNEYPMAWQVDPTYDPFLFTTARAPQLPGAPCILPPASSATRRLRASKNKELYAAAIEACANKEEYDNCVDDIVFTGEINLHKFYS